MLLFAALVIAFDGLMAPIADASPSDVPARHLRDWYVPAGIAAAASQRT